MSGKTVRELLAFLGVAASLVFVGLEVRQNTIASRAAAYQEIGLFIAGDWYLDQARDPAFSELMVLSADSTRHSELTDVQWSQLQSMVMSMLRASETIWLQVEEGLLPPRAFEQFGFGEQFSQGFLRSLTFRTVWPNVRGRLNEDFRAFFEERFDI